jgi:NTE family protein
MDAFVPTGGGNLGAVHVGMLHVLCEQGVAPDVIVGTSVGAIDDHWRNRQALVPAIQSEWSRA